MFIGILASLTLPPLSGPLIMRHPTVNQSQIVFSFAGDLWSVPKSGGNATRLTTSIGEELNPIFSPDGTMIAFTGFYSGNPDVYVMPATGGEPKRITYHPAFDAATGWSPDGKSIIYTSSSASSNDLPQLWTVSAEGGTPKMLPLPSGLRGSYSPDGSHLAYAPGIRWQESWKRYRGGQTTKIWIADLSDSRVKEIPRNNANDTYPMWIGDSIYFLSDRNGPVTLFKYDVASNKVTQCLENSGFDMKSATATDGVIAIEQLGEIKLYDTKTGQANKVEINIAGEFPEARPQYKDFSKNTIAAGLSPNGLRGLFASRGDIWTVPASKGDARNLTNSSDSCERDPSWSPDGQKVAYLSDAGGEYHLEVRDANGKGEAKQYKLEGDCFYYTPNWSPDSKKIAYTDNKHNLWWLELATGKSTLIDTNPYENPTFVVSCVWSPDSKWVAYYRDLPSHICAVFLYSLETGKPTQVTDGLSDARFPAFDNNGKYFYFAASTNSGPSAAWLDLSSFRNINSQSSVYCVVLRNDLPSPLAPESDDEKSAGDAKPESKQEDFRIDLEGLDQRIIGLPLPPKAYVSLQAGPAGSVLLMDLSPAANIVMPGRTTLTKFSIADKSSTPLASSFASFTVTPNGEKMLVFDGATFQIASTMAPVAPGQGALDMSGLVSMTEPMKEWKQIFHEAWRVQRDFFYDPNYHGINLAEMEKRYEPFVANIRSRADLNYLFEDMLGELCVGHMYISGGDMPNVSGVPGGLLGADYTLEGGRYRFAKVFNGENWNPGTRAPLTAPGINVKEGEYIIAINGVELKSTQNIYQRLEAKAEKQVTLKVGPSPDGIGAREVTVVPVANETGLRFLAWREGNRRTVDRMSNGKLGYMHIPDTNIGGWFNFNRFFYAQVGKQGLIVDERFNHGGQVDDYMVDNMERPLMSMWTSRYGADFPSPFSQIYGPKVMITNQFAGSGGDYFPWHFKKAKVGPVVGTRTWGGLVGILVFPTFIDGGSVTSPNIAFYNPNGTWDVENHGVDPDIEVDLDPYLWRNGHDAQLERAIAEAMKLLEKQPKSTVKKPNYPDKSTLDKIKR